VPAGPNLAMVSFMDWDDRDGIAVLTLDRAPVNALDAEFLREIASAVDEIKDSPAGAMVVTGAGATFSAGADLPKVLEGGREYVEGSVQSLSDCFGSLFTFPKPAVAAVNGHAIAGGCVIACACDYRIMAAGSGKIGLAELRVGVPFPMYALEIVRFAASHHHLQELVYLGLSYEPEEGLKRGLLDEICEPPRLLDRSLEEAERLASIPAPSFALVKQALRRPTIDNVERYGPENDAAAKELWTSDEILAAIRTFMERLLSRSGN
jgi:enoyl-CoA hydratase